MQIERVHEDGSVVFQNGKTILADVIMHCTGYKYHFPFLETNGIISVDDNRVGPLYKHIFLHHLYQRSLHRYNMEVNETKRHSVEKRGKTVVKLKTLYNLELMEVNTLIQPIRNDGIE
ncbi:unnamed protein product [Brassica oleracea var. botrytis]|uniref:Flavin-containing monooxygenase n=1 Tax=Brassica napus TaxID=3708 RepID=A0A816JT06_BRANA|nr:unnamed protein product [Brassica napus]